MQNFIEINQTVAETQQFILLLRGRPSIILDLWSKFWDDPQRVFGGVFSQK